MTKGTARLFTNIKPMSGGDAIAKLYEGDYVFGDEGLTDITGFTHYYKVGGTKIELGKVCKAWKANLILKEENEETIPEEPPATSTYPYNFQIRFPDGLGGWLPWQEYKKNA